MSTPTQVVFTRPATTLERTISQAAAQSVVFARSSISPVEGDPLSYHDLAYVSALSSYITVLNLFCLCRELRPSIYRARPLQAQAEPLPALRPLGTKIRTKASRVLQSQPVAHPTLQIPPEV